MNKNTLPKIALITSTIGIYLLACPVKAQDSVFKQYHLSFTSPFPVAETLVLYKDSTFSYSHTVGHERFTANGKYSLVDSTLFLRTYSIPNPTYTFRKSKEPVDSIYLVVNGGHTPKIIAVYSHWYLEFMYTGDPLILPTKSLRYLSISDLCCGPTIIKYNFTEASSLLIEYSLEHKIRLQLRYHINNGSIPSDRYSDFILEEVRSH